jgi:hypothetical protein
MRAGGRRPDDGTALEVLVRTAVALAADLAGDGIPMAAYFLAMAPNG